jgi:hypothetical protein
VPSCRREPGLSLDEALAASSRGELDALLVAGVEVDDLADPAGALTSLGATFIVSLEIRRSALTDRAHVVLPVASAQEKPGTFVDWEGRPRSFRAQLPSDRLTDQRVLGALADGMGTPLRLPSVDAGAAELAAVGRLVGRRARPRRRPPRPSRRARRRPAGRRQLEAAARPRPDAGRRAAPRRDGPPAARVGQRRDRAAARRRRGRRVTISSERGAVTLPVAVGDVADGVVWLPANSVGSRAYADLGVRRRKCRQRCGSGRARGRAGDRGGGVMTLAQSEEIVTSLGNDPFWLTALKALVVFAALMVTTILLVWAERRIVARCSSGSAPTGPDRSASCRRWPTASSSSSRRTSGRATPTGRSTCSRRSCR